MGAGEVSEHTTTRAVHAAGPPAGEFDLAIVHTGHQPRHTAELIGDLRRQGSERVVVIASSPDPAPAVAAFSGKATGYLVDRAKTVALPAPRTATTSPVPGGTLVVSEFEGHVGDLSAREIEIISLIADGRSNPEIGAAIGVSVNTVKGHLARMARKLHTGDRSRMVLLALRSGVIR
ncbi:response regulator transcription factor [Amycolatopsis thailandensis]|uniref:response regulator transcription factor n=1 Tax=Amycolatopsis thailandensis TaxID=589330 RepID=UPI00362A1FE1